MTLTHSTDRLESDRLVLRRVTPDDLPFYTRASTHSRTSRSICIPRAGRVRPKRRRHG
jgi:hypothetical protein